MQADLQEWFAKHRSMPTARQQGESLRISFQVVARYRKRLALKGWLTLTKRGEVSAFYKLPKEQLRRIEALAKDFRVVFKATAVRHRNSGPS